MVLLACYFHETRGLRQRDPFSSYLFVIFMEVLSLILKKAFSRSNFKYHGKTKESGLTHLCFANDLILFSKGDIGYFSLLFYALHRFLILVIMIFSLLCIELWLRFILGPLDFSLMQEGCNLSKLFCLQSKSYWPFHFILLKRVIKEISSIFFTFSLERAIRG